MRRSRKRKVDKSKSIMNALIDAVAAPLMVVLLALFVAMTIINPVAKPVEPEESALYVTAIWDIDLPNREDKDTARQRLLEEYGVPLQSGHSKADFDLWAYYESANDGSCQIVGYPGRIRKSKLLKLDEDDRGWDGKDVKDDMNREVVGARSMHLPPGRYMISVHLFSSRDYVSEEAPLVVALKIEINKDRPERVVLEYQIPYTASGKEYGVQFVIDSDGNLVSDSILSPSDDIIISLMKEERQTCTGAPRSSSPGGR